MTAVSYCFVALGCAVLLLMARRGWPARYPAVFLYFASVVAGDLFFSVACPVAGIDPGGRFYFRAYYLLEIAQHGLKLAVAAGLYRRFLRGFPHLRAVTDIFLYLALAAAGVLFLATLDPRGSFLYLAAVHFGRWAYFLLAGVCVGILLVGRLARVPMEAPFRLTVGAFLVLSLPQVLSFTLLAAHYARFSPAWAWTSALSMNGATCLLGWAALRRTPEPGGPGDAALAEELAALLVRLETRAGLVLRRILPAGRHG